MNKKERVDAALRGETVDRVPVSVWGHTFEREWSAQELADTTVENFIRYDWDYVKVSPRTCYHVENWGARYRPSGNKLQPPIAERVPIRSASDWRRLRHQESDQGSFGEQLRALQLINHGIGYDAYFAQSLLCPLGVAEYLVGNKKELIQQTIREDRSAMHAALRIITQTLTEYAIACFEYGASGIFYSTNRWASEGILSADQYHEFGEQYDLELLDALKSRSKFTILHNEGEHIYFDLFSAYPVQVMSWNASGEGNPNLRDGRLRWGKAVMGGINEQTLKSGSPGQVQDEIGKALELNSTKGLLLAPGSAIAPETPTRNLEAIRHMLS